MLISCNAKYKVLFSSIVGAAPSSKNDCYGSKYARTRGLLFKHMYMKECNYISFHMTIFFCVKQLTETIKDYGFCRMLAGFFESLDVMDA